MNAKLKNEVYGTITLDISRITNCDNDELAIIESESILNEFNIEEILLGTINRTGLRLHNATINWDKFFGEDE